LNRPLSAALVVTRAGLLNCFALIELTAVCCSCSNPCRFIELLCSH